MLVVSYKTPICVVHVEVERSYLRVGTVEGLQSFSLKNVTFCLHDKRTVTVTSDDDVVQYLAAISLSAGLWINSS